MKTCYGRGYTGSAVDKRGGEMKSKVENKAVVLTAETEAEKVVLLDLYLSRSLAVTYDRDGELIIAPTLSHSWPIR